METPLPIARHDVCGPVLELAALFEIASIQALRSGQREMLRDILHVLEARLAMTNGAIMLLSADGTELAVEAVGGAASIQSPRVNGVRYRRGEGITGIVLETGTSIIVPRIAEEPRFCNRLHQRENIRDASFICVAIALLQDVIGTLSVDLGALDDTALREREQFLRVVASLIASDVHARRKARLEREALETENLRLRETLENENYRLREALCEQFRPENIIGNSRPMREVYARIFQVAKGDTTCLIRGESGVGKEMVATAIHCNSSRAAGPFVKVNCAALNENLVESELFGHEKGAFTNALFKRVGRVAQADKGTLFLDEIGDFSPAIQVKLLRLLQEKEYESVGSNQTMKADIRIVAATNRDLEKLVSEERFRSDLYYRINVFSIWLPSLRERRDDILLLANHFTEKLSKKLGKAVHRINTPAINMMMAYHWPGNVRELENCIEHAVLVSQDDVIRGENLPPTLQLPDDDEAAPTGPLMIRVHALERDMISDALKRSKGNVNAAARELGITSRIVRYKISKLKINLHGEVEPPPRSAKRSEK